MTMIFRLMLLALCASVAPVFAQSLAETAQVGAVAGTVAGNAASAVTPAAAPAANNLLKPTPNLTQAAPQEKESLFFTRNQLIALIRASQGYMAPKAAIGQSEAAADPGPRVISLSGIVFRSSNDWTIWLNGERVTPRNIPERVMGLKVQADLIHLRWMDLGRQRIVNITLRPHQQFALDTDTIYNGG